MSSILVIGATSAIAEATSRIFAARESRFYLLGRDEKRLDLQAKDLEIRGAAEVTTAHFDAADTNNYVDLIDTAFSKLDPVDIVLIAYGSLPDQVTCEQGIETTTEQLQTNALSTISLLTHIANQLEMQGHGMIAVMTSVAGDRGRKSNYVYGAAKGMVSIFLQGLRNRLYSHGIDVLDIKPAFVDTPMTSEFKKGFLWSSPKQVANDIAKAIDRRKSEIYTPFYWRYIMFVIRNIPESIFKRLSL